MKNNVKNILIISFILLFLSVIESVIVSGGEPTYPCSPDYCGACGGNNQVCCIGDTCNYGFICQNSRCNACGNGDQQCCSGNKCNSEFLMCKNNVCTAPCSGSVIPCNSFSISDCSSQNGCIVSSGAPAHCAGSCQCGGLGQTACTYCAQYICGCRWHSAEPWYPWDSNYCTGAGCNCASIADKTKCEYVYGCDWQTAVGSSCTGNATLCSSLTSVNNCIAQKNCNWDPTLAQYNISISPKIGTIRKGELVEIEVVASSSTSIFPVTLSCLNVPTGAFCIFNSSKITPSVSGNMTHLTIITTSDILSGTYNITIRGTNSYNIESAIYQLNVSNQTSSTGTDLIWIKDPNGNLVVNGDSFTKCNTTYNYATAFQYLGSSYTSYYCYYQYYSCNVNGQYQGMAYIKNITFPWTINLIIPWKNLWYCNSLTLSLNPSKGFIYQGNSVTSTVTATFPSDSASPVTLSCPNLPANVRCSFSENPITPSTSGTNSILTIYTDSATITGNYNIIVNASNNDVTGKAIYNLTVGANGDQICQPELGENCKTSIDCFCSINELCCSDGTCGTQGSCQSTCNNNGECELGEGCSCSDCYSSQQKDSCGDDLVCDSATETCQCPSDKSYWCANENQCSEDQDCKCGNGVADTGENCFNCPDDAGCLTETLCYKENNNYVCGSNPPGQCDNNGICDRNSTYYETCDCSDCTNSQDRCLSGLICKSNERCGCKPFISDGICPNDPACETIDPDCVCPNPNNLCEVGENQINCPQDCNTVVSVYPQRMYPGSKVNVTVYFNDSRFYIGRDVKLALYIDDVPWTTCEIDNKKWTDMGWSRGENWETTLNSIRIVSKNTFAQINFECLVPSDIDQGTHTLKAVPYMYSKETPLNNGQTEILVQENCLENKFIKFLIFYFISISLIL